VAEPVERLGAALRRAAGRPADGALDRRLGWAIVTSLTSMAVAPLAAVPVGAATWSWPLLRRRRDDRRRAGAVVRELPEVLDLLVLVVGAGLTVPLAVAAVGRRADGLLAAELRRVTEEVTLGRRSADALAEVPARLGEAVGPLVAALLASERYGAPLVAALDRLAADARADRRRRAEEAARRVPVKLLFPLVLCTLPAFALLTVAPLIAGAAHDLRP
jgi:tight adherence protein C